MNPGDTFLAKVAISDHIWVVAYHKDALLVIFNFTTQRTGIVDDACVVTRAEYPTLNNDSAISYQHGIVFEGEEKVNTLASWGVRRYLPRVPEAVLKKIQRGAIASRFTPEKIKLLLRPIVGP